MPDALRRPSLLFRVAWLAVDCVGHVVGVRGYAMYKRNSRSGVEEVKFEIPQSSADVVRSISGSEPAVLAKTYLIEYAKDGRVTKDPTVETSVGWNPKVYAALIKHVGKGGVSNFIRETIYAASKADGYELEEIEVWKWGHVESAGTRRKVTRPKVQPGRQSVVVPITLPVQWYEELNRHIPGAVGKYLKAETQKRLEQETGKQYPVQKGLGAWLGRYA